ncbi:BON domain-containing protein [Microcoleus vaginatus]|uniref:BON domain-containing protein n=1 Tax=Microcoleus vaginatus TaxID=119532 RepID=UPI00403F3FA5
MLLILPQKIPIARPQRIQFKKLRVTPLARFAKTKQILISGPEKQRNNVTGGDAIRADGDLQSEVRSKLEVNITKGALTVDAKDGLVTVGGTVPNETDLAKIEPLAKEIKGVKQVNVTAVVAPAAPASPSSNQ